MSNQQLLQIAINYIEDHLQKKLRIAEVAAQTGLSSWHFQRVFHAHVGETVGTYIRSRKLSCSLEELLASNKKVIDIAFDYDFSSPETFSRAFKTKFGKTPQEIRRLGIKIVPEKKLKLENKQLVHLVEEIHRSPQIKTTPNFLVAGIPFVIASPFSKRLEYLAQMTEKWQQLLSLEDKISNRMDHVKIGIIKGLVPSLDQDVLDDSIDYVAAVPVSRKELLPSPLQFFEIPGGQFAVFQYLGFHEQTQFIIDFIYSTWLPNSDFKRREGVEFTRLDHSEQVLDRVTSNVQYWLPIE